MDKLQEQVDFMVLKYQQTMKSFDSLSDDVKSVFSFLKSIESVVSAMKSEHENLSDIQKNQAKYTLEKLRDLNVNVSLFSQSLKESSSAIGEIGKNLSQFKDQINCLNSQISLILEKNKDFATKDHLEDVKNVFKKLENYLMSSLQTQSEKNNEHSNRINSLNSFSTNIDREIIEHKTTVKKLSESIERISNSQKTLEMNCNTAFHDMKGIITKYIDDKIAAIPKPVIPSLDEAKEHVNIKVEPALLDARNANLRSSNNEQKIFLMEKKIEQLQLMLNKLQLG